MRPLLALLVLIWPAAVHAQARGVTQTVRTVTYPAVAPDQPSGLRLSANSSLTLRDDTGCEFNRVENLILQTSGVLVVANSGNHELCFFSATGTLIRRVGRAGAGPGEYRSITGLELLRADSLLVADGIQRRISVLRPDGSYARSFVVQPPIDTLGYAARMTALTDGTILIGYSEVRTAAPRPEAVTFNVQLFRYDTQNKLLGAVGRFAASEHFIQATPREMGGTAYWDRAFGRKLSLAAFGDGFLAGDGAEFSIAQHDPAGHVNTLHRMAWTPRAVGTTDIAAYKRTTQANAKPPRAAVLQKLVDEMPFPALYPAFRRVLSDRSARIWLEVYPTAGQPAGAWVVFEPATRRTSVVLTPARFRPLAVSATRLCGVTRDELDLERVQCFAVQAQ